VKSEIENETNDTDNTYSVLTSPPHLIPSNLPKKLNL